MFEMRYILCSNRLSTSNLSSLSTQKHLFFSTSCILFRRFITNITKFSQKKKSHTVWHLSAMRTVPPLRFQNPSLPHETCSALRLNIPEFVRSKNVCIAASEFPCWLGCIFFSSSFSPCRFKEQITIPLPLNDTSCNIAEKIGIEGKRHTSQCTF